MLTTIRSWWQDKLLRGVIKNSSFLFSSNTLSAALGMLNSILATRLLGVEGLGLVATVQTFVSNINRLLSFRMSEVVVKYLAPVLALGEAQASEPLPSIGEADERGKSQAQASAIVKGIGLIEAASSLVAYLVLLFLASWAAKIFAKDISTTGLFTFYGLMLLVNLVYETSVGVLQAHKRFDRLAIINTVHSIITASLILLAFILKRSLMDVLAAYLVGKAFAGLAVTLMAARLMSHSLGGSWWKVPLREVQDWRSILGFALNTNLNGTVNLLTRDNAPLYLAALSPVEFAQGYVGYFKLGMSIINFVTLPIDPFIWPTYAEITRTIALRQWQKTRSLLKRVSTIAGTWTIAAAAGIALLGWWLIPAVYGPTTAPVYPVVLILLVGYGTANILNWNRPLLLALGRPSYPLIIAACVGLIEGMLILWLVPPGGYLAMAGVLAGYLAVSVMIIARHGFGLMQAQEAIDLQASRGEREESQA